MTQTIFNRIKLNINIELSKERINLTTKENLNTQETVAGLPL